MTREELVKESELLFNNVVASVKAAADLIKFNLKEVTFENASQMFWSPWAGWLPSYQMKALYSNGQWQLFDLKLSSASPRLVICQIASDLATFTEAQPVPKNYLVM